MATYHRWTEADYQTLRDMTAAGSTAAEIATTIGSTAGTVAMKRQQLGVYVADGDTCPHCAGPITRDGKRGRRKGYCSEECGAAARAERDRQERAEARAGATCAHCGGPNDRPRKSKYCGRECAQRAWYERARLDPEWRKQRSERSADHQRRIREEKRAS